MKALTVKQPWASLIALGLKTIEVRSQNFHYRGPLLIHSSRTVDREAAARFGLEDLPLGRLVCLVELFKVEPFTEESWLELQGEHLVTGTPTRQLYGLYFAHPLHVVEEVPLRGQQGLFEVSEELARQALGAAAPPSDHPAPSDSPQSAGGKRARAEIHDGPFEQPFLPGFGR